MSTVRKRPQLSLDELRLLKWWLGGALTLIAVWSVFYLDVDAWVLLWVVTIAVPVVAFWPRLPAYFPAGYTPPRQGSVVTRDEARPFEITDVRKRDDGQLNVFVREIMQPN